MAPKPRHNRGRKPPKRANRIRHLKPTPQLNLSIVTYPSVDVANSMAREIELVKAAVLYADHVELFSINGAMIGSVVAAGQNASSVLAMLAAIDDETLAGLGAPGLPSSWRQYAPILGGLLDNPELVNALAPEVGRELVEMSRSLTTGPLAELQSVGDRLVDESGANQLAPAIAGGLLTFSDAGLGEASNVGDLGEPFGRRLAQLMLDPKRHLVFDDRIADLAAAMIAEGYVIPDRIATARSKVAHVGNGLLARLPVFPDAPLDELIDLRTDLDGPLSRYRGAAARLAAKLEGSPFTPDVQLEIDNIWHAEVQPALADIEEEMPDHGLVRDIAKHLGTDVKAALLSANVFVGMNALTTLSGWLDAAATAVGPFASAVSGAARERSQARDAAQVQEFYYLYAVRERAGALRG